jgi:hypothetical protein
MDVPPDIPLHRDCSAIQSMPIVTLSPRVQMWKGILAGIDPCEDDPLNDPREVAA